MSYISRFAVFDVVVLVCLRQLRWLKATAVSALLLRLWISNTRVSSPSIAKASIA